MHTGCSSLRCRNAVPLRRIKLDTATDPPYNTGEEGWVYNDNVNDPKIKKWLGAVVGKEGEDLTRHDKWLCMMYPRLKLLQKLLADDGVIFINIGEDEHANLKLVCDEIFGVRNYVTDFGRQMKSGGAKGHYYTPSLDYVLTYAKNIGQHRINCKVSV